MATCDGTNIFSSVGRVVVIDDDAIPFIFEVDDDAETFNNLKGFATGVGYQAQGAYQFMHSLREFIYVYVFTERIGQIAVNGLVFSQSCEAMGTQDDVDIGTDCVTGDSGIERLINWYECNRITTRAEPISIKLGETVIYDTFLTNLKVDVTADTHIGQFVATFAFVPRINPNDDYCFNMSYTDCQQVECA